MDKKERLIKIIKSAKLPSELEKVLVAEVEKKSEVTDEFILDVADTLERIGEYFENSADIGNYYVDQIIDEAQRTGDVFEMLDEMEEQLKAGNPRAQSTSARESLQMYTGSGKAK